MKLARECLTHCLQLRAEMGLFTSLPIFSKRSRLLKIKRVILPLYTCPECLDYKSSIHSLSYSFQSMRCGFEYLLYSYLFSPDWVSVQVRMILYHNIWKEWTGIMFSSIWSEYSNKGVLTEHHIGKIWGYQMLSFLQIMQSNWVSMLEDMLEQWNLISWVIDY